jgi:hypothetical protein
MKTLAAITLAAGVIGSAAVAQSPAYMIEDCRLASQQFYQEFDARSEATYEGQRVDGTHAVNGTIYLETRGATYQCSYNRAGDKMVDFFAEQQSWPSFVRGGGSPYQTGNAGTATQLPANTVTTESVRFPSGATSTRFPAQLPAGMSVRYALGARNGQFLDVNFSGVGGSLQYRILNPDGSTLLDPISVGIPYRGQLWQSGDHVVEVINRSGSTVPYQIYFEIE